MLILTRALSIIIPTLSHSLPDCQLLVDIVLSPVAGPYAPVLPPDAQVLAHLDDLLALLNTQQVGDDEALKARCLEYEVLRPVLFFDIIHLAIEDLGNGVAGECVQGLRGGLLYVSEVLLP